MPFLGVLVLHELPRMPTRLVWGGLTPSLSGWSRVPSLVEREGFACSFRRHRIFTGMRYLRIISTCHGTVH